jgi:peptide/nickel transport system permease protein
MTTPLPSSPNQSLQADDSARPTLGRDGRERSVATTAVSSDIAVRERKRRRWDFFRRVLETRLVAPAMIVLATVVIAALAAGILTPHDPNYQDYNALVQGPSASHPLGTDDIGRDVLARIIYGSRISLQVGVIAVGIALVLGVTLGLVSGYAGGIIDEVVMRFVDAVQAFPALVLALAITAALGPRVTNAMIAIGFVSMPAIARLTRGQTLMVRETEYVTAANVIGASPVRIMTRHIFPNITAPLIVQGTLLVAAAILIEASLSFLGVGVQPPTPTWGGMLRTGSQYLETAPWIAFAAGTAIFVTVLAFNLVGDGLRRALDPRLRTRR